MIPYFPNCSVRVPDPETSAATLRRDKIGGSNSRRVRLPEGARHASSFACAMERCRHRSLTGETSDQQKRTLFGGGGERYLTSYVGGSRLPGTRSVSRSAPDFEIET